MTKIKSLNKTINNLFFEKECLKSSKNETHIRIENLEIENKELQSKCEDLKKIVLNFLRDKTTWRNYLYHNGCPLTKKVLLITLLTKRKLIKISLFKRHLKMSLTLYAITV